MDKAVIDSVLYEGSSVFAAKQPFGIRFILGEEERWLAVTIEVILADLRFHGSHDWRRPGDRFQGGTGAIPAPSPAVAEPKCGQDMDGGRFRAAIVNSN